MKIKSQARRWLWVRDESAKASDQRIDLSFQCQAGGPKNQSYRYTEKNVT